MNKEQYDDMSIMALKELVKTRGLKGLSTARKSELIDALCQNDDKDNIKTDSSNDKATLQNALSHENTQPLAKPNNQTQLRASGYNQNKGYFNSSQNSMRNNQTNRHTAKLELENMMKLTGKYFVPTVGLESMEDLDKLASGKMAEGILEIMQDKDFGFIRCDNYLPGADDVYVSNSYIRRFNLKTGDVLTGMTKTSNDKFSPLLYLTKVNARPVHEAINRPLFEELTPIFPNERIVLERAGSSLAMRLIDLIAPIGKGQRGMIVSPPKAGKTTLLKEVAKSVIKNNKEIHLIILLIDERPEEVTDIKEAMSNSNVEIIYSTFDELPDNHRRVSEMVLERAKRLVEHGNDVMILVDSITRLTRAYNLLVPTSGRTLSGGLDPSALYRPKRFFGAARNIKGGGSLTILATALVDTGSKMDDVVYEEFKGTGNMELVLDRKLSERRIFPAVDIQKSSTRREDLLMKANELEAVNIMRRGLNSSRSDESVEAIISLLNKTVTNNEFIEKLMLQRTIL